MGWTPGQVKGVCARTGKQHASLPSSQGPSVHPKETPMTEGTRRPLEERKFTWAWATLCQSLFVKFTKSILVFQDHKMTWKQSQRGCTVLTVE